MTINLTRSTERRSSLATSAIQNYMPDNGALVRHYCSCKCLAKMTASSKDSVLIVSLVLSLVSIVLLFGVTWYFQSSLDLLQQQVEYDRELLLKLQEKVGDKVKY